MGDVWTYTADHTPGFYAKVDVLAHEHGVATRAFLRVMNAESGVFAKARNPSTDASGLIQFMPATLRGLGWLQGTAAFRELAALDQMPMCRRYFAPHRGKLLNEIAIYLAVFLPAYVGLASEPDYMLCARKGHPQERLGFIYAANAIFDANGDGRITVGELGEAIARQWRGPRCAEMERRIDGRVATAPREDREDLRTWWGIQQALVDIGYDLGRFGPHRDGVDGVPGERTIAAIMDVQRKHGLVADGAVGRATRPVLAELWERAREAST